MLRIAILSGFLIFCPMDAFAQIYGDRCLSTEIFPLRQKKLMMDVKNKRRLLVTSAAARELVAREFMAVLKGYAARNNAGIVVILPENTQLTDIPQELISDSDIHILFNNVNLSPWLALSGINMTAEQAAIDRQQSLIIGSPKQGIQTLPNKGSGDASLQIISTGAITVSRYRNKVLNNVLGAVILEKSDGYQNNRFHWRHIKYIPRKQGFFDIGSFHTKDHAVRMRPEAIVLGDIRAGQNELMESVRKQLLVLRPKMLIVHNYLQGEVAEVAEFLNYLTGDPEDMEIVIPHTKHLEEAVKIAGLKKSEQGCFSER